MAGLIFVVLVLILYMSSLNVSRQLGQGLFALTHSRRATVYLLALLFLPGTFIHEMAHLLAATALGVRTGAMELIPRLDNSHVIMGSVPVAETDRIRRALIGAAPFFTGLGLLLGIGWWLANYPQTGAQLILAYYLSFEIGNTCFASSKDMEGTLELVAALLFILAVLYLVGLRQPVEWLASQYTSIQPTLNRLNQLLLLPLGFNLATLVGLRLLRR